MKKKNVIRLSKFILIILPLMVIEAITYLVVVPKIKTMCDSDIKCANAHNCTCEGDTCRCYYFLEDGSESTDQITCPKSVSEKN